MRWIIDCALNRRLIRNVSVINEGNSDAQAIPVGPRRITSDELGHFRLFVDGEQIVDADYRLFYVHRGMEKLAETRMGYNEVTFLSDRVCGICGFAHSVAYTNSVENDWGLRCRNEHTPFARSAGSRTATQSFA